MLSDHERRAWDEIERELTGQSPDPSRTEVARRPRRRRHDQRPVARGVLVLVCCTVFLLPVTGAAAALALAAAAALGWLLWRWWPQLRDDGVVPVLPRSTDAATAADAPTRRPGAAWLARYLKRISEVE